MWRDLRYLLRCQDLVLYLEVQNPSMTEILYDVLSQEGDHRQREKLQDARQKVWGDDVCCQAEMLPLESL